MNRLFQGYRTSSRINVEVVTWVLGRELFNYVLYLAVGRMKSQRRC
ncbi:hypothetical protein [Paenibacillus vandeheii]